MRRKCRTTGLPAVADDTGLFVAALDGEPGVDTAYFAGPDATHADNRAKLLAALEQVADRRAEFVTVALVVWPTGEELLVRGVCSGSIAEAERGVRGWGYDPVFVPDDHNPGGRTFAEMSDDEKNAVSHRGRAFAALRDALANR